MMLDRSNINTIRKKMFDIKPSKKVARNLFGEINHEEVKQELNKEYKVNIEQKSKLWNFDFEKYKPLTSQYNGLIWEKLIPETNKQIDETKTTTTPKLQRSRMNASIADDDYKIIRIVNESPPRPKYFKDNNILEDDVFITKSNNSNCLSKKRKGTIQPKIDDFMKKKKRRVSMEHPTCKRLSTVTSSSMTRRSLSSRVTV